MEIRDRLVAIVLAAGLLLGMAGWQAVSPWLGLAVAVLALVAASSVYRVDRRGPAGGRDEPGDDERAAADDRPLRADR